VYTADYSLIVVSLQSLKIVLAFHGEFIARERRVSAISLMGRTLIFVYSAMAEKTGRFRLL